MKEVLLKRYELFAAFHAADDAEVVDIVDDVLEVLPANARVSFKEARMEYDPEHNQDELCRCKHVYYRHFDWADNYRPGCKYCGCTEFRAEAGLKVAK